MSDDTKFYLFMGTLVLVIVVIFAWVVAVSDEHVETKLPESEGNCFVREYSDNRLFGDDTVTRTIFCER